MKRCQGMVWKLKGLAAVPQLCRFKARFIVFYTLPWERESRHEDLCAFHASLVREKHKQAEVEELPPSNQHRLISLSHSPLGESG